MKIRKFATIVILQLSIGIVLTTIVLYNFQADLISEKAHKLSEETMIDVLAQNIDIFITR